MHYILYSAWILYNSNLILKRSQGIADYKIISNAIVLSFIQLAQIACFH